MMRSGKFPTENIKLYEFIAISGYGDRFRHDLRQAIPYGLSANYAEHQ